MAKAILQQVLSSKGMSSSVFVDPACIRESLCRQYNENAWQVIKERVGNDLLADHNLKSVEEYVWTTSTRF
jgi:hypothetical protein